MPQPPGWKNEPGEQINVKADLSAGTTRYLALGLTDQNIAYLKAGHVIGVDLQDLGYPGAPHKVILCFGATEESAREALPQLVMKLDVGSDPAAKA
jgi:hypothetical protein